jgi:hypothetical protein
LDSKETRESRRTIHMQLTDGLKMVLLSGAMALTSSAVELPRMFSEQQSEST